MKALIIATEGFEDSELFYPKYRLEEAGIEVDIANYNRDPMKGKYGYVFKANVVFDDVAAEEYGILIIPGGKSPEYIRNDEMVQRIAKHFVDKKKVIGAICHGGQVLISVNGVKGKKVTSWKGIKDDMIAAGGRFEDKEVVVDGNLVTSRCPADLPAFMREIVKLIGKRKSKR